MHPVLTGVRVLDFGQYMAGPMAAMLLADQGADVIRIDPPGGPRWDTPANATWNRNKRGIVLDLKTDHDAATARRLIESADVLIENFRPGVMDRLGLGETSARKANQRLIYCSLPGFGSDDPRACAKAWEGVLGAATSTYRPSKASGGRPVYTVIPYASAFGAFLSAVSVAVALNARERTGRGQHIEIPLFDATFTAIGQRGLLVNGKREAESEYTWNRPVLCKDGRWFMYDGSNKNFDDFLDKSGLARWRNAGAGMEELQRKFDEIALTRTAAEWEIFCADIGTEGVTCHTSAEWLAHPQALESRIIADFEDPQLGRFRGPGINLRMSETPTATYKAKRSPDADRAEILSELATQRPQTIRHGESGLRAALEGVKVLDLCIILSGPACGRTLAEFGADVVKIDSPHVGKVLRHNDINRAKRSMLLDLKTQRGREIFWRLVDWADVVAQNFRSGIAEKLGIGYEAVRARKPEIIYASMNTYGQSGPFAGRPGHEGIAQAATGMQVRYGGDRPTTGPFPGNDYGTGLVACYGVALALWHRQRTGKGQFVDTALAYTATMLQSHLIHDYAGKEWNEPSGQQVLGEGPWYRAYEASDGWLFMAARDGDHERCPELADITRLPSYRVEAALEARIQQHNVAHWIQVLHRADIGAHRIEMSLAALMQDPLVRARGLSITRHHEGFGQITTTAPSVRMREMPPVSGQPAPRPGSDAVSVLSEIGMQDELESLVREGVVKIDGVKAGC